MAECEVAENGWIAATQRPDGTWRKARRVKEGYVPPDEVEKYESKGKQWVKNASSSLPPGVSEEMQEKTTSKISKNRKKNERKKQLRKEKKEQADVDGVEEVALPMPTVTVAIANEVEQKVDDQVEKPKVEPEDPVKAKKIKNLKKKLRQIEDLKAKVKSGEVKELTKEQREKISRRKDLERELQSLEI